MKKTNLGLYTLVLLLALVALAYLGGLPAPEEMPFFLTGSVILVGLSLVIGAIGWYLLYRPLPENYKISGESPIPPLLRQGLALLLIINMSLVALGGAWDEVWHSIYGIPFGEDLFWRPHILIYIGIATLVLFAFGLTALFLTRGKGTLAQRLRSDPLLAWLLFLGLFMAYALPADPIWHEIYGEDISSFSIPHILLGFLFVIPLLVGVGVFISSYPKRNWQSILRLRWFDAPPIFAFVSLQLILLMLFAANWELLTLMPDAPLATIARNVPDWLFPLLLVFVASFIGVTASHSLRYYGVGTLIGLLCLGFRLLLLRLLGHELLSAPAWIVTLLVYLSIDAFYLLRRGKTPSWWQAGLAAGAGMVLLGLPVINWLYPSPQTSVGNLPFMLIACFGGALLSAWFAQPIGDYLADSPRQLVEENRPKWQLAALTSLAFGLAMAFFIWFVVTATAPIL